MSTSMSMLVERFGSSQWTVRSEQCFWSYQCQITFSGPESYIIV